MEESLEDAKNELKRVDHLVYVSLKYTRTVDVLRNTIERILSAYDAAFLVLLKYAKEKKLLKEIPPSPGLKCEILFKLFDKDPNICDNVEFYLNLRKLMNAEFKKRSEYRRHVTMIADVEGKEIELNMDLIKEHYQKAKDFVGKVEALLREND